MHFRNKSCRWWRNKNQLFIRISTWYRYKTSMVSIFTALVHSWSPALGVEFYRCWRPIGDLRLLFLFGQVVSFAHSQFPFWMLLIRYINTKGMSKQPNFYILSLEIMSYLYLENFTSERIFFSDIVKPCVYDS